ncbi:PIN domain-like protein [Rhypophila decipiens]|uniref:PIN domain-like protein n=1 Tax=Rhypophila decipiens TaxID=261697 RepID=A0AAN7AZH9_9PEZI|nr:PIN domain-like protein [Rhypophila decipiens]
MSMSFLDTPLPLLEFKAVTSGADEEKWGGMNHIVRDFYFHVGHLPAAGVERILVFDGPGKPREKGSAHPAALRPCAHATGERDVVGENERTEEDKKCERELSHIIPLCRTLLDCMGLPYRDAPAEAEAECAAMERLGIFDAVLTRDGDAFVFGSRRVLQKMTAEKKVARTAIQLSRHFHFGSKLKAVFARNDPAAVKEWKSRLVHTLRENPGAKLSHQFPSLATTIENNPNFPSRTIVNYYLNPKVSTDLNVPHIDWTRKLQIQDLRKFTRTFFNWRYQLFAGKFVRLLALPALSRALLLHGNERTDGSALIETITRSKEEDGVKQVRVAFIPANVVPFDIAGEPENSHFGGNVKNLFDSSLPVTEWVPSWLVEYGAPEAFHRWQEKEESKTKGTKRKTPPDDNAPRRGPGRPQKSETSPQKQSSASVTVEPAPKRPRGRPRKDNSLPQQKQNTFIAISSLWYILLGSEGWW